MKLMYGLHQESPRVVELEVGFHHGCSSSDHKSPRVVKLEVGLHQGCFIREQEVPRGDKASDGFSPQKLQKGEVHDGTSPWESQEA